MSYRTASAPDRSARDRRRRTRGALVALVAAGALALQPRGLPAQMPGLPLLQNGFVRPGAAVAANFGSGDGADVVGAAGAWTPGSGRFQLSAGVGALAMDGFEGRKATGGLRAALPIRTPLTRADSPLGVAGFIGVGGASLDAGTLVQVPLGLGIGYRRPLGGDRAVAVFATPFYQWTRVTGLEADGEVAPDLESNLFRVSLGAEALVTRRIGVTIGYELGTTADDGRPGPAGGIFGAGLAFVF